MHARLLSTLPGRQAQASMATPQRRSSLMQPAPTGASDAAVLVLLRPSNAGKTVAALMEWQLLLIRRACYDGVHSGQIALPGGRREPEDHNLWHTACRETFEEVGVPTQRVHEIAPLTSLYVPPSNFMIHPFVALDSGPFFYQVDNHEVQDCQNIPIHACNPALAQWTVPDTASISQQVPAWQYGGYMIWGATAMILAELFQIVANGHMHIDMEDVCIQPAHFF